MRLADRVSGAVVIAGAALLLWAAQGLPGMPGQRFGPATFPTLIGMVMAAAGAVIAMRSWLRDREEPWLNLGELAHDRRAQASVLWLLGGLALMLMLWRPLGFPLLGGAYAAGLMLILGVTPLRALFWSVMPALAIHLVFTRLLLVPLPPGPLRVLL